jgi:hypothetical protein
MLYAWICILATTLVLNTIFVLTLLAALNWEERAMFLFATIVLAGGILFTLRTVRSLAPPAPPARNR